jgi:hypothetical protein
MQVPRISGQPYDEEALGRRVAEGVREIVRKQREVGVDVVNDGELSKPNWIWYLTERLSGFEYAEHVSERVAVLRPPLALLTRVVFAGAHARGDRNAVPGVDRGDCPDELRELLVCEMPAGGLVGLSRNV